ncbi:MAG: hypothetical protein IKR12_02810 [Clostridia bacterium]|nr:hypothetical protein [Clostridia bacterium]
MDKNDVNDMSVLEIDDYSYNVICLVLEIDNFNSREEFLTKAKILIDKVETYDNVSERDKQVWRDTYKFIQDKKNWELIENIKVLKDEGIISKKSKNAEDDEEYIMA